jgi:hypothetical protein
VSVDSNRIDSIGLVFEDFYVREAFVAKLGAWLTIHGDATELNFMDLLVWGDCDPFNLPIQMINTRGKRRRRGKNHSVALSS